MSTSLDQLLGRRVYTETAGSRKAFTKTDKAPNLQELLVKS
jgi:hypothetical protein